ncbi:MAG: transcription termination factor NusA [Candidatus Jorgensenbacteria bacterium]
MLIDLKALAGAAEQIAAEKGIQPEQVLGAIEAAIAAAYKREYRKRSEIVKCQFNLKSGEMQFSQVKTVVDPSQVRIVEPEAEEAEKPEHDGKGKHEPIHTKEPAHKAPAEEEEEGLLPRYNPDRHIFLEEARQLKSDAASGEEMEFPLETHEDFGRIAAQTAKQVILQSIREAERSSIREEFADKEGTIASGIVQRFDRGNVYVDIGRAVGIMFGMESIPGEHYRIGERLRFYILAVQDDPRRPGIVLSRAHPNFVKKLFEMEVPEIADGTVEIKGIAREPGSRTKVAVASHADGVDPVGAAVGQRGTRVMAVTNELGNEKIDIIEWAEEPEKYIGNSLSPAKAKLVEVMPRRESRVLVAEDQLSLAIGKGGQNVRLAAKLTGWKIDVRSQSRPEELQEGGVAASPEGAVAAEAPETAEAEKKKTKEKTAEAE